MCSKMRKTTENTNHKKNENWENWSQNVNKGWIMQENENNHKVETCSEMQQQKSEKQQKSEYNKKSKKQNVTAPSPSTAGLHIQVN